MDGLCDVGSVEDGCRVTFTEGAIVDHRIDGSRLVCLVIVGSFDGRIDGVAVGEKTDVPMNAARSRKVTELAAVKTNKRKCELGNIAYVCMYVCMYVAGLTLE